MADLSLIYTTGTDPVAGYVQATAKYWATKAIRNFVKKNIGEIVAYSTGDRTPLSDCIETMDETKYSQSPTGWLFSQNTIMGENIWIGCNYTTDTGDPHVNVIIHMIMHNNKEELQYVIEKESPVPNNWASVYCH